ncbi:MAG: UDP-2,4-diacetamido-2,4,6-trideoxy-beta-L-altropyranose hydrolase [Opitutales bacterium]
MKIAIRADANEHIGTGHVMRTLALAESMTAADFELHFLYSECNEKLLQRWRHLDIQIQHIEKIPGFIDDAKVLRDYASDKIVDWVIVDGHHFGDTYQRILSEGGFKLASIDDYGHCQQNVSDLLINQNANASETMYSSRKDTCKLLLGPEYAILRQEFRISDIRSKEIKLPPENLLITTGGADPHCASVLILKSILSSTVPWAFNVRVIAGSLNPNLETLKELASQETDHHIEVFEHVNDIVGHMGWADIAISGAGTTLQELLQQGVPTIAISLVQNQTRNAMAYARHYKACAYFGPIEEFETGAFSTFIESWAQDSDKLLAISQRSLNAVDGKGISRIISEMQNMGNASNSAQS